MRERRITDPREFGKVAVMMGGSAAERDVSIKSGTAVLAALQRQGVEAVGVDVASNLLTPLLKGNFDRVFNIIHGRGGEDGVLQGALEALKIPYTGSGVLASSLCMDKLRTKLCWRGYGLPTPDWHWLKDSGDIERCIEQLGFPIMVKPSQEGSSFGMSKAGDREQLVKAVEVASQFNCDVYAESWVIGDEYTIAMLDGVALPAIRLETPNEFYDYEAKYIANTTRYHCPCGLNSAEESQLQALALRACEVVGVRGWGRVDAFIDGDGNSQLIEVNTVPGMTDHSLVPMAAKACGIEFDQLVWRILETSVPEKNTYA